MDISENSEKENFITGDLMEEILKDMPKAVSDSVSMPAVKSLANAVVSQLKSSGLENIGDIDEDSEDIALGEMEKMFGNLSDVFGRLSQREDAISGETDCEFVPTSGQDMPESNKPGFSDLFDVAAKHITPKSSTRKIFNDTLTAAKVLKFLNYRASTSFWYRAHMIAGICIAVLAVWFYLAKRILSWRVLCLLFFAAINIYRSEKYRRLLRK